MNSPVTADAGKQLERNIFLDQMALPVAFAAVTAFPIGQGPLVPDDTLIAPEQPAIVR